MVQQTNKKRRAGTTGVKALIATASVAATLAGWALLPANDPQAAAGANDQTTQPPAFTVPDNSNDNSGNLNPFQQDPGSLQQPSQVQPQTPDQTLPQIQVPQDNSGSGFPMPFTRSHSSR